MERICLQTVNSNYWRRSYIPGSFWLHYLTQAPRERYSLVCKPLPPPVPMTWVAYYTVAESQTIRKADWEAHTKGGKQSQPTVSGPTRFPPPPPHSSFPVQPQSCIHSQKTHRRKGTCPRLLNSWQARLRLHIQSLDSQLHVLPWYFPPPTEDAFQLS